MDSQTKKNLKRSRQMTDNESDEDIPHSDSTAMAQLTSSAVQSGVYPRFLVVESLEEDPITKLSPFVIEKVISGLIGEPKSVKKLRNGTLLIEVNRKSQSDNLLKIQKFFNQKVRVFPHNTLNTSKGTIRDPLLKGLSEEEILDGLTDKGVTQVRRIKTKRDGKQVETNVLVLTFNTPNVPSTIKIFYRVIKVSVYIPNPLRCFNCQKFGHHEDKCRGDKICFNCGTADAHFGKDCGRPAHCYNCDGDHPANSKNCPTWKKEKEIQRIKFTNNISFAEARKLVEPSATPSYASVVQSSSQPASFQTNKCQHCPHCNQANDKQSVPQPAGRVTKPAAVKQTSPSIITNTPHYAPPSSQSSSSDSLSEKNNVRSAPKQKIQIEGKGGAVGGSFEHPNRYGGLEGLDPDNPTKPALKPKPTVRRLVQPP